ncbi:hypothetical protein GQ53DRAFT_633883 [Thozetella sp. PMI_491]|nr:hypothetical protein GQ53DRAFT_633883 [Thozetella sp. PMI_491]
MAQLVEQLPAEIQSSSLLQLLSNSLILCNTTPYLSAHDLLSLASSSRQLRYVVYNTPHALRRLDLTNVKAAQLDDIPPVDSGGEVWRNVQLDEHLTEDDFYSGPLRGIFSSLRRTHLLQDVHTLVLDGLSVTAELVHEILNEPSFAVRLLSIRAVRNLNEDRLRQALEYACRPSRAEGMPRLRGLYVFGQAAPALPSTAGAASPEQDQEAWYVRRGNQFPHRKGDFGEGWANTLAACQGIIAFDAVLCNGPRHQYSFSSVGMIPHQAVATRALDGCANCGFVPEGWTVWGEAPSDDRRGPDERRGSGSYPSDLERFPLLWPPPLHSSSLRATMCPSSQRVNARIAPSAEKDKARFVPRCFDCLRDRYCSNCNRWWCETCYTSPSGLQEHGATNNLVSNYPATHQRLARKVREGLCVERCWSRDLSILTAHRVGGMALPAMHALI